MRSESELKGALTVPTELSHTAVARFEQRLAALVARDPDEVGLDCSQLVHTTSGHIKLLWQAFLTCRVAGKDLVLDHPSQGLTRVLHLLDLSDFFLCRGVVPSAGEVPEERSGSSTQTMEYSDRFEATVTGIDSALERFMGFVSRLEVPEATAAELRTIFYEVTTNVRMHGRTPQDERIDLVAMAKPRSITLTFTDGGIPFDPTQTQPNLDFVAAARSGQRRGFGLAMIKRLASGIWYARKDGKVNILTIEKQRGS